MNSKFAFENLIVWQEAINFSEKIYTLSNIFPKTEIYGLTSQIRRASLSVALNIAEGKGRKSAKEFVQFLYTAKGSIYEIITCSEIALRLKYINIEQNFDLRNNSGSLLRKLSSLINKIKIDS